MSGGLEFSSSVKCRLMFFFIASYLTSSQAFIQISQTASSWRDLRKGPSVNQFRHEYSEKMTMVLNSESEVKVAKLENDLKNNDIPKKAKVNSVNDRLLEEISNFNRPLEAQLNANSTIEYEEQDLNGVSPKYALLGSFFAAVLSLASYKGTSILFEIYEAQKSVLEIDNLFATRLSGLLKQVIVGLGSLATGIFAFNALGLFLLSIKVTDGVLKGELDPTPNVQKEDKTPSLDDVKLYDYDDFK